MSLSQSAPMTVAVDHGGKTLEFKVACLTMGQASRVQAWLNRQEPPTSLKEARETVEGLPETLSLEILQEARIVEREWPPQLLFNPQMALSVLMSTEGGIRELALRILQQSSPSGLTEGDLLAIADSLDGRTLGSMIEKALNIDRDVAVSRDRSVLAVVGPDGIDLIVRATAALLGSDADDDRLRQTAEAIASRLHDFGVAIPLEIRPGEGPTLPKGSPTGRGGRSARSTSAPQPPS